jgi:spore maturation protein CgeB
MKKILYVGNLNKGGTSLERYKIISSEMPDSKGVNVAPTYTSSSFILRKVFSIFQAIVGSNKIRKLILIELEYGNYDYVWIDKGNFITKELIFQIKTYNCKVIHYCQDHIGSYSHNFGKDYFSSLPYIDLQITTNRSDYVYYENFGYNVILDKFCYCVPENLTKVDLKKEYDIAFIGHHEEYTEKVIRQLSVNFKVTVFGPKWIKVSRVCDVKPYTVWGDDYINTLKKSKIVLSLYSRYNLNTNTLRPYEITAAGSLLVTERTKDIENDFIDRKEIICFDNIDELNNVLSYYLQHEDEREEIAGNGHRKTMENYLVDKVFGTTFKAALSKVDL